MAKGAYIGILTDEKSVARKTKKIYLGIDNVARAIKKAYLGVDNVAQLVYMSGIEWNKYSCNETSSTTYTKTTSSGTWRASYRTRVYTSYTFSSSSGFSGSGGKTITDPEDGVGYYVVTTVTVALITSVEYDSSGNATYFITTREYYAQSSTTYSYSKGSTSYGIVIAEEGALPESGTLIKGSATSSYCVIEVGSTYYYYTKVTT